MKYKGKYFIVKRDQGIFREGMICHCFDEQDTFVRMWFQHPLFGDMHEVKVPKEAMEVFRERK